MRIRIIGTRQAATPEEDTGWLIFDAFMGWSQWRDSLYLHCVLAFNRSDNSRQLLCTLCA